MQAAVKIVPKQILASSRMSIRDMSAKQDKMTLGIEREIVIMKLIEHPNVLGLMDVYETSKELFLILEYVAGGELFDYLVSKGRLRPPEARAYFRQIIFGLHYCHSFNICHRDLKPENLLLDGSKRVVKVADFGMAALQPGEKMLETSCGSPHYASPEIVSGKSYKGTASDIWSCGIILFALLCGRLPFDDPNIQTLLGKVRLGKFEMPDYLEPQAKDLIWQMLSVDPERRLRMRDVMRHPWFTDNGKLSDCNPISTNIDKIVEEEMDFANLDMDILSNLKTLWPEYNQEDIIAQLTSKGHNWPKTFYTLLIQHRENYSGDEEDEEEFLMEQEQQNARSGNSLGLSLGITAPPVKDKGSPLQPRSPVPSSLNTQVPSSHAPASPNTSRAPSPQRPVQEAPRSPIGPRESPRMAPPVSPQPSVYTTPGSPSAKRPLPQPQNALSSPPHSPVRPSHVPSTGFGSAQHAQKSLRHQQQRESGVVDNFNISQGRNPSPNQAAHAHVMMRGRSDETTSSSPDRSRTRPLADDTTPRQHPPRPSSRASTSRPKSVTGYRDEPPSVELAPEASNASMEQFFREIADEISAIRVNGERPISLQRKLEQLERMTKDAYRTSSHRSTSPRRVAEEDPMAQFDDAEDDVGIENTFSPHSGATSESSGHPYTPTSPAALSFQSPALQTKPLALSDKENHVRRQPSVITTSTGRTSSIQSTSTAHTASSNGAGGPSLGRRRSFLGRMRSQKKQQQDQLPSPSLAYERLQDAGARHQQNTDPNQTGLQQKNPGLGLDIAGTQLPTGAATSLKSPTLSTHSAQSGQSYPPTPSTPGSVLMSPALRSASQTPKQSWFAGLFNWKPATFTLMSVESNNVTHAEAKRLLHACGARVFVEDSEHSGVLKCSLADPRNEGLSTQAGSSKPLRFRVEFNNLPMSSGSSPLLQPNASSLRYATSVTLIQEKGSLSTFKHVYQLLSAKWTLDVPQEKATNVGLGMSLGGAQFSPHPR